MTLTTKILEYLKAHYNDQELQTLCFYLDVVYDDLGGNGRADKMRELVSLMERQGRLDNLLAQLEADNSAEFAAAGLQNLFSFPPARLKPPNPPIPFVNRVEERQKLKEALQNGKGQAHTLTGLSGMGKTALAAQVVQEVTADFPGGVLWVSLETSPQPETIWAQIAAHYGQPATTDPAAVCRTLFDEHQPLLVLDNAETAPETADVLVKDRGKATVLLTSRDRLVGIGGKPLQTIEELPPDDAVALFQALTGQMDEPGLVKQICQLAGYMPLAIELAAGYVMVYQEPLADYIKLLEKSLLVLNLGERKERSIAVTFGLSVDRLTALSQLAFTAVALDGGESSSLAAIAAGMGEAEDITREACNKLVRHSLVGRRESRYRLHPLVRRYVRERAGAAESTAIRDRLTAYYLAYAQAHSQPTTADYNALAAEHDNLLTAMEATFSSGKWEQIRTFIWSICSSANGYLSVRGYWQILYQQLEQALRAAELAEQERDTAFIAGELAILFYHIGNLAKASEEFERLLNIFTTLGEQKMVATTLHSLGVLAQATGDYGEAHRRYQESLDMYQKLGNQAGRSQILHELGRVAQHIGHYTEARRYYQESLDIAKELDDWSGMAATLGQLANLAQQERKTVKAEELYRQAIAISEKIGHVVGMSIDMFNLAMLYRTQGRLVEALSLLEQAVAIAERSGYRERKRWRGALQRLQEKLRTEGESGC